MVIAGLIKTSLLDYPEKIATVVFTQGCNFRCPYCHNPELNPVSSAGKISEDDFFNFLKKRKKLVEAVTITGGEPTVHKDLIDFIKKIKKLGYLVKLDSNGSNPEALEKLFNDDLVDYIAMDIKAPLEKYQKVTNSKVDKEKIRRSIEIIIKRAKDYEFRTTLLPKVISQDDFRGMLDDIQGAKRYFLQFFRLSDKILDPDYVKAKPYTTKEMQELLKIAKQVIPSCEIR